MDLIQSREKECEVIVDYIKAQSTSAKPLEILEAGCVRRWQLNLNGVEYVLTGVDLDAAALKMRKDDIGDLDIAVEGDLRSVQLPEHHYDVIYSSYVLEHIKGAEQVLNNLSRWVKPGGIIVIRIPDPHSVHGFITRMTPHWFHVLYYRIFLGFRNAGKPGYEPYPVHYDPVVSRRGIWDFCKKNDFTVLAEYGDGYMRPGKGVFRLLIHSVKVVGSILSFGALSSRYSNLLYIVQKQQAAQPI
jgi:SAM-dependent methyltransferase